MATLGEIAQALGAQVLGDESLTITGAAEPADAGPTHLALAMSPKFAETLNQGQARAAILWEGADWQAMGLDGAIYVVRARHSMAGLTAMMDQGQGHRPGIHPSAVIDPSAELGQGVSVGPLTVISAGAKIGANSQIGAQCFIGENASLGPDAILREMTSLGARVTIGARFRTQPGVRVGSDAFSYVTPEVSGAEMARKTMSDQGDTKAQAYERIHSLGAVTIGDDVEIGANAAIDNGTIRDTVIGNGTKLDNLVHIGHNCVIGNHCLICGQVGMAGSAKIGDFVVMAGQVGVADNIFVGDRVIATGATKLTSNVPAGRVMMGYPAVKMDLHTEIYKAQRRLPRLFRDVAALQKAVFKNDKSD